MATRKHRTKKRESHPVCYLVEIKNWDWSFSFGLNHMRGEQDPYSEFRHLEVTGEVLRPKAVKAKAPKANLTFLPDACLENHRRMDFTPKAVGSLQIIEKKLQGLLSMPLSALPPVLQLLSTGHLKYAVMNGAKLHYRKTRLHHYSIDSNIDPDELVLSNEAS